MLNAKLGTTAQYLPWHICNDGKERSWILETITGPEDTAIITLALEIDQGFSNRWQTNPDGITTWLFRTNQGTTTLDHAQGDRGAGEQPALLESDKALSAKAGIGALSVIAQQSLTTALTDANAVTKAANDMANNLSILTIIVVITGAVITLVAAWKLSNKLAAPIANAANNTDHHATNLAATASQLTAMAAELQESSNTAASSAHELSANTEHLSRETQKVAAGVSDVSAAGPIMASEVADIVTRTDGIQQSSANISRELDCTRDIATTASSKAKDARQNMEYLVKASQQIGKITSMIDDISSNTNLLALNATIEAASAGEAGKGFSVVADEIKNLAAKSSEATAEITQRVEEIQKKCALANETTDDIAETITSLDQSTESIASAIQLQDTMVQEIRSAAATTTNTIEGVKKSIEDVASASQGIAETVGEAAIGSRIVAENISIVKDSVVSTQQAVSEIDNTSTILNDSAKSLRQLA